MGEEHQSNCPIRIYEEAFQVGICPECSISPGEEHFMLCPFREVSLVWHGPEDIPPGYEPGEECLCE